MPDRGLELKCPAPHTHVAYLARGKCPADYVPQVQGCMWICELDQWDFVSFHPDMPPLLVTVERNEAFIDELQMLLGQLHEKIERTIETIQQRAA